MSDGTLAHADFRVFGNGFDNVRVDETVHAELYKSGCFQYGNETGMVFEWSNGNVDSFDTRYENVSVENFTEFAENVLKNFIYPTLQVELVYPCNSCPDQKKREENPFYMCSDGFGICKACLDYHSKMREKNYG